jgi:hypothetical protein
MGPIQVVVQDGNNLVLEVTPTPNTTVILDRGIAGPPGPMGDGDVDGPASATDNAVARFDGTTGKLIQNSVVTIGDAGNIAGVGTLAVTDLTDSSLTSGRVTYAGTGGNLVDSANLTFDGTTLTANALTVTNAVTLSAATANGVMYANGSKVLTTGSALTFDGTNLTVPAEVYRTSATSYLRLSGGDGAGSGANVLAFGQSHASIPGALYLSSVGTGNVISATVNGVHLWQINGSEQMRLTSTGLGIGTSSPDTKLTVSVADNSFAARFKSTNGVFRVLPFETGLGVKLTALNGNESAFEVLAYQAADHRFVTGVTERMRLDSSGNLGIGTSSPGVKLDIANTGGSVAARLRSSDSGYAELYFGDVSDGAASAISYEQSTNLLRFYNGGSVRATIDSSGNLGLGVTPSAWTNSRRAFQIGGDTVAALGFAGAISETLTNAYVNSGVFKYYANGPAGNFDFNSASSGGFAWRIAGSGTAGNAISFTQAMTLDASGNLGVGTTSPGQKVECFGTLRVRSASQILDISTPSGRVDLNNLAGDALSFSTGSSERARIDSSGNLLVGTTNVAPGSGNVVGVAVSGSGYVSASRDSVAAEFNRIASDGDSLVFRRAGTQVGSISVTTLLTAYNTTSDYRLKTVIGPVANAGQRIDALQPVEYTWNADGSRTRGFLAHQFQEVYAGSVSGTKDAVDADGNPVYQSMQASTSEVIADLVAEIQSLRARVAALESN